MYGKVIAQARKEKQMTQVDLAARLGLSQTYLSLIEKDRRTLGPRVAQQLVWLLDLSPTLLPLKAGSRTRQASNDQSFIRDLAAFGYPKYAHVEHTRTKNPVSFLVAVLSATNVEGRVIEALPWLLLKFHDLDWKKLIDLAKLDDFQNRLGFLTCIARRVAERNGDKKNAARLKRWEDVLENSRLAKQDTLCRENMTEAERDWVRQNRAEDAKHWNILTNLSAEGLDYER